MACWMHASLRKLRLLLGKHLQKWALPLVLAGQPPHHHDEGSGTLGLCWTDRKFKEQ
jgi:hypothetical protein